MARSRQLSPAEIETGTQREAILGHREFLLRASVEANHTFDRTITALNSGALALSITFVRQFAPEPTSKELLFLSWLCFGLSLLLVLISFRLSDWSIRRDIEACDRLLRGEPPTEARNSLAILTEFANCASLVLFVGGVGLLASFAGANLK